MTVECTKCGRFWPQEQISRFYSKARTTGECNSCAAARVRAWRRAHPGRSRAINRRAYEKVRADPDRWEACLRQARVRRLRKYLSRNGVLKLSPHPSGE